MRIKAFAHCTHLFCETYRGIIWGSDDEPIFRSLDELNPDRPVCSRKRVVRKCEIRSLARAQARAPCNFALFAFTTFTDFLVNSL